MNCLQTAPLQQISAHRSLQHEYAEVLIQNTTQSRACCAACGNVQRAHNKPQSISGHQKVERQVQMPMRCPCRQFHSDVLIPCCAHPCDDTSVNKLAMTCSCPSVLGSSTQMKAPRPRLSSQMRSVTTLHSTLPISGKASARAPAHRTTAPSAAAYPRGCATAMCWMAALFSTICWRRLRRSEYGSVIFHPRPYFDNP